MTEKLKLIEVIMIDKYRDGGSTEYQDQLGRRYLYPAITAFHKHEDGVYSDWPNKGGKKLPVVLKVVKELNGVQNSWWKEDYYIPRSFLTRDIVNLIT